MAPLFDNWLQSSLQRLYDSTLEAPLPEEILRLVQDHSDPSPHR